MVFDGILFEVSAEVYITALCYIYVLYYCNLKKAPHCVFFVLCFLHCVLSVGQGVTVSGGSNAHNTCSRICCEVSLQVVLDRIAMMALFHNCIFDCIFKYPGYGSGASIWGGHD